MERRLAAILAADIVGYSAMMGADEAAALEALRLLREDVLEPEIERRRGEVVKRLGDGWLAEFGSVVDAVDCAVAAQQALERHEGVALRIGVHIGDIVHADGDIYGDGVNIAARLEARGAPGHVLISDDARRQIAGKSGATFHDNGPVELKNIAEPVRVWSWPAAVPALAGAAVSRKPGVHVDPFEARGDDAEELAEGAREDLAAAFARQTGVTLVTERGLADYVVGGSIRAARGRWRLTVHLTETAGGRRLWTDRYDETGDDIFEIQDRLVYHVTSSVRYRIPGDIAEKAQGRSPGSMTSEELINIAFAQNFTPTREAWTRSTTYLETALEKNPRNWMAMTMLSFNRMAMFRMFGWRAYDDATAEETRDLLDRAIEINPNSDALRMSRGAYHLFVRRDHRAARIETEQSLKLNPNFHHSISLMSHIEAFDGNAEAAQRYARQSLECEPGHPYFYLFERSLGCALAVGGDFAAAAEAFQRADHMAPGLPAHMIGMAACRGRAGDAAGAEMAMAALLAAAPDFNLAEMESWPFQDPGAWTPFRDALAAAGAPEGPMRDKIRLVT